MSDRRKTIKELEVLEGKATHIEISLSYDLGGHNWFTYVNEERGIYLHVSPVEKSEGWRSYTAFSGVKMLLLPMKRFNKKVFDSFIPDKDNVEKMLNHVLTKNNIILKENEEA